MDCETDYALQRNPSQRHQTISMRTITQIIIHCTDSEFGNAELIDRWHRRRGWNGIGYHFVILNGYINSDAWTRGRPDVNYDGIVETGRPVSIMGAHCKGQNKDSIGICLVGKKVFTSAQIASLKQVIESCQPDKPPYRLLKVYPHSHYDKGKTCPNLDLDYLGLTF